MPYGTNCDCTPYPPLTAEGLTTSTRKVTATNDAVPGYTTYTWFKALHTGTFRGQCAQLCGSNHAAMVAFVKVVTPDQYNQWLARQKELISAQNSQVSSLRAVLTAQNQLGN